MTHAEPEKNDAAMPGTHRASIKDIARLAHVSHSTVSRALANSSLVNTETAERIRRLAQQAGYCPSAVARSLVTRSTRTIGVVVTNIADPFVAEVVEGIESAANDRDYSVFLANSNADPAREVKAVRSFHERRVDGIIVTASRVGAVYLPMLSEMRAPIVLVNNQHPSEFVHSVTIANFEAARDITRHLIEEGHSRIAYIGDQLGGQSDTERFEGYRAALDEAGVPFEAELAVRGNGRAEGGVDAACALLEIAAPPTAIFCYNDMTAIGALRAIHARHWRVPRDISLAGFDDLYLAQYTDPPLTTVRQPMREMGRIALDTLFALMRGATTPHSIKVPGQLVVRESTGPNTKEGLECSSYSFSPHRMAAK